MALKDQLLIAHKQLDGFEIPSLPAEIIELQNIFSQTEFPDMTEVAEIIGRNTVLSGEVILLVNQSQFKRKGADDITTIRGAVESLGVRRLNGLVTGLAFKTQVDGEVFDSLLDHSVDIANVSAELALWVEDVKPEEAYMAGLFHNAGAIIMAMKFGDYEPVFVNTLTNCYSGIQAESKKYQAHHGVYGLLVAKKWCLESRYAQVMLMHHQRNLEVIKDPGSKALVAIVQLANAIVSESSFEHYCGNEVKEMLRATQSELMIDDETVDEIRVAIMSNSLV